MKKQLSLLIMVALTGCQYEGMESQTAEVNATSVETVVTASPTPTSSSDGVTGTGSSSSDSSSSGVTGSGSVTVAASPSPSPSPSFSPRSLSNVRFHYESDNITNSGWSDSAGNITGQSVVGSLNMVTSDGFRALEFDGTIDGGTSRCKGIDTGDTFNGLDGAAVNFTFFAVVKPDYDNNGNNEIFGVPNLSVGLAHSSPGNPLSALNVTYGDFNAPSTVTASETQSNTAYRVLEVTMSAGDITHLGSNSSALTITGTSTGVTISAHSNNAVIGGNSYGNCYKGRISEIIMYNRSLNSTERGQVVNYLKNKFGL